MAYLVTQLLLTAAAAGYSVVPVVADLNRTHATNPLWDPHARFHVVWQVSSYVGVALVNLVLVWAGPPGAGKLLLATALAACMYGGFFVAVLTRRRYGGALYNDNGYPPVRWGRGTRGPSLEPNLAVFSGLALGTLVPAAVLALAGGL